MKTFSYIIFIAIGYSGVVEGGKGGGKFSISPHTENS